MGPWAEVLGQPGRGRDEPGVARGRQGCQREAVRPERCPFHPGPPTLEGGGGDTRLLLAGKLQEQVCWWDKWRSWLDHGRACGWPDWSVFSPRRRLPGPSAPSSGLWHGCCLTVTSLCPRRQLSEENANLQEYVEKETQEKKRLSRTNEELLWKLQTGDPTSPIKLSPTSPIYRGSSSGPSSPAKVSTTPR